MASDKFEAPAAVENPVNDAASEAAQASTALSLSAQDILASDWTQRTSKSLLPDLELFDPENPNQKFEPVAKPAQRNISPIEQMAAMSAAQEAKAAARGLDDFRAVAWGPADQQEQAPVPAEKAPQRAAAKPVAAAEEEAAAAAKAAAGDKAPEQAGKPSEASTVVAMDRPATPATQAKQAPAYTVDLALRNLEKDITGILSRSLAA